jgi:serine/threonine protein kinase/Tfp pilus assembly protein PilF
MTMRGSRQDKPMRADDAHADRPATESEDSPQELPPSDDALADDLRWAVNTQKGTHFDAAVPIVRLNELLTDYQIVRELGRGGMGIVYEARQVVLNRSVALKVLPSLLAAVRPEAAARFRREAELAAGLEHTNIVGVYDFGEVEGTLYYAMQLIEGRSLRDVLQEVSESGAIDVLLGSGVGSASESTQASSLKPQASARAYFRRVAEWIADVADALHYAHDRGVIHRDIKPSNLLVATDGRLMISDFGLARAQGMETMTADRALLGTARYMSPEQVSTCAGSLDRRTDIYSLGATLYELLAQRSLFAAADDREILDWVLNRDPPPPHRFVQHVPRDLETICLKAIEKQRDVRYSSAKEMADDLRRWLLDLPITARRPPMTTRVAGFVRRRKGIVMSAAAIGILALGTGVFYVQSKHWYGTAVSAQARVESQDVQLALLASNDEFSRGRYEAAWAKLEGLPDDHPDAVRVELARARIRQMQDRIDEAIELVERTLEREPNSSSAHFTLAQLYRDAGRDPDQVAFHAQRALESMPTDSARAYRLQASSETNLGRAIELLHKAIALDPAAIGAVLSRCQAYRDLGDDEAMLADAERAVAMRPHWSWGHGYKGQALLFLKRPREAIGPCDRAVELDPGNAVWWLNRAMVKNDLGAYKAALADVSKAIELDATDARFLAVRARAYAGLGQIELALRDCAQALRERPRDVELLKERALHWFNSGRYEEAIADYTSVVQVEPEYAGIAGVYGNRAVCYILLKLYDRAVLDLSRCIELDPRNAKALRNRGYTYGTIGRFEEAIGDYSRSLELEPDHPGDLRSRAQLYLWSGSHELAIADLTRLITGQEDPIDALFLRGMAYELMGVSRLALADYERLMRSPGTDGEYARLWSFFALPQPRDEPAESSMLREAPARGAWTKHLFDFALDEPTPEELLASAAIEDEKAEAYYYIGRKALLDGRVPDARAAFSKCVSLDRGNVMETDFARALLAQMQENATIPATGGDR